jgi:hypothetical protein
MKNVKRKHRWVHTTTTATCNVCGRHEDSDVVPTDTQAIYQFRLKILNLTDCPGKAKEAV